MSDQERKPLYEEGFTVRMGGGTRSKAKMDEGVSAGLGIGAAIMGGGAIAVALIVVVMIVKWVLSFGG